MSQSLANEYCRHDAVIDVVRALAGYKTDSPESLAHDLRDIEFQTLSSYTDFFGNVLRQIHQNFGAATFFVEIGANDGKFADPLFEKVNAWKWRGLLVEPLEDVFRLLKQNYAHLPGLSFENSAIAESQGEKMIRRVPLEEVRKMEEECRGRPDEGMCRYAIGVGSIKNDSFSHWILKERGVDEKVHCMRLDQLFAKHKISTVHIFQVDTEGYDGEIVLQLFNPSMREHFPMILQMEADHLDHAQLKQVIDTLRGERYAMRTFGGDLLALSPDFQALAARQRSQQQGPAAQAEL